LFPDTLAWRAPCAAALHGRVGVTVVPPTPGAVVGVLRRQRHVLRSQIGTLISPAGRVLVESCWQFAPQNGCSQEFNIHPSWAALMRRGTT
jgi:hypothetical protein